MIVVRPLCANTGTRRDRAAKAAPNVAAEPDEAAPMEGVESAAEALKKPAPKRKAAAKPKTIKAAPKVCHAGPSLNRHHYPVWSEMSHEGRLLIRLMHVHI